MVTNLTGIEKFVCSAWSGWDEIDTGVLMFYSPKIHDEVLILLNDERIVTSIVVDTRKCQVDFYFEDDNHKTLDFKVQF
ncbi:hypothetical protein vBPpSSYP_174 [Pseudomonas phage vB_PpS_SYP]|nr:hypothetical protein vBPpSSYP_174 [Pseudomonas phage vB_PpS_SYP]